MVDAYPLVTEYRVLYDDPQPHGLTPWIAYEGTDKEEAQRIFRDISNDAERAGLQWNIQFQVRQARPWQTVEAVLSAETVEEAMDETKEVNDD